MSENLMQFFSYDDLPSHRQEMNRIHQALMPSEIRTIDRQFYELAQWIQHTLPRSPERTVCLRKLLEAKDAAVRTSLYAEE